MAGAVPMLFSRVPGGLDDQLDRIDGVMLAAGHDIDPARYGQAPHPLLGALDRARLTDRVTVQVDSSNMWESTIMGLEPGENLSMETPATLKKAGVEGSGPAQRRG